MMRLNIFIQDLSSQHLSGETREYFTLDITDLHDPEKPVFRFSGFECSLESEEIVFVSIGFRGGSGESLLTGIEKHLRENK
jgi:hypothetical protein